MESKLESAILQAVDLVAMYFGNTDGENIFWLNRCPQAWRGHSLEAIKQAAMTLQDEFATIAVVTLACYDFDAWESWLANQLMSDNNWTQWGAALALGQKQHPAALPILLDLLDNQSQSKELQEQVGDSYFLFWTFALPHILNAYQNSSIIPTIQAALANVERIRQSITAPIPWAAAMTPEEYAAMNRVPLGWPITQCEFLEMVLINQLGTLRQWHALEAVSFSPEMQPLWQVLLVGMAIVKEIPETDKVAKLRWSLAWNDVPVFAGRVVDELRERYNWDREQIIQAMANFAQTECIQRLMGYFELKRDYIATMEEDCYSVEEDYLFSLDE